MDVIILVLKSLPGKIAVAVIVQVRSLGNSKSRQYEKFMFIPFCRFVGGFLKKTFWLTASLKLVRLAKKFGEKSPKIALEIYTNFTKYYVNNTFMILFNFCRLFMRF